MGSERLCYLSWLSPTLARHLLDSLGYRALHVRVWYALIVNRLIELLVFKKCGWAGSGSELMLSLVDRLSIDGWSLWDCAGFPAIKEGICFCGSRNCCAYCYSSHMRCLQTVRSWWDVFFHGQGILSGLVALVWDVRGCWGGLLKGINWFERMTVYHWFERRSFQIQMIWFGTLCSI